MTIISVQNLLAKCHVIKFLHVIKFWRPLYFHSCGQANYTVSGHSKSRRKIDDFGPDQNARFSE
jgi:hypothetical protein